MFCVMFGMLGLTTDLGRVYIVKMSCRRLWTPLGCCALQLNGTQAGLTAADTAAANGPAGPTGTYNGWDFDAAKVPTPHRFLFDHLRGLLLFFQFR